MPSVKVRENEPFEYALRRFKRSCEKAGVLAETRRREFYEKPTQERKRKAAAAVKRNMRRLSREAVRREIEAVHDGQILITFQVFLCQVRSSRKQGVSAGGGIDYDWKCASLAPFPEFCNGFM